MSISCRDVSYKYIHSHLHQVYPSFTYTPSNPPKCFHLGHEMFLYNMPLERLGRGGSLCKLFQHLGKLYLDYLGKLYLDYLCWMTMIFLGTPASPYTWKNKYKLSELLIVGKLFLQYLDK